MKRTAIVFGGLFGSYVTGTVSANLTPEYGFMVGMVFGAIAMTVAMVIGLSE